MFNNIGALFTRDYKGIFHVTKLQFHLRHSSHSHPTPFQSSALLGCHSCCTPPSPRLKHNEWKSFFLLTALEVLPIGAESMVSVMPKLSQIARAWKFWESFYKGPPTLLLESHLRTKLSTQVSRDALHLVDVLVLEGDFHAISRGLRKPTLRMPLMTNQLMFFSMMVAK